MSRHRKDPLRPLTADERTELTRLSRSQSAPAAEVDRARALLTIADGASYTAAAHLVGRRHNETISAWISRFNRDGLAAVRPPMAADRGSAMAPRSSSASWPSGRALHTASRTALPPGH
jgi:transposase-like protein